MPTYDPFGMENDQPAPEKKEAEPKVETSEETPAEEPTPKRRAAKASPAKEEPKRSSGIAYGGRPLDIDLDAPSSAFPSWPQGTQDDLYCPDEEVDYTDLSALNRDINRTRSMIFRVKNRLQEARRAEAEASDRYRRAFNKQMIGLSGGTAEKRKAIAEFATEDIYSDYLVAQTVVKDLTNLSYTMSRELDTLKTLSDNLRKQMSIQ